MDERLDSLLRDLRNPEYHHESCIDKRTDKEEPYSRLKDDDFALYDDIEYIDNGKIDQSNVLEKFVYFFDKKMIIKLYAGFFVFLFGLGLYIFLTDGSNSTPNNKKNSAVSVNDITIKQSESHDTENKALASRQKTDDINGTKNNREEKMKQTEQLKAYNAELMKKKEVVFLPERVEAKRTDSNIYIYGKFYNGTVDNVTGVKSMMVDVQLNGIDKELLNFNDVSVDNASFHKMSLAPGAFSDSVTIIVPGRVVKEKVESFKVRVHKIHWTRRVLVKR